MDEIFRKIINPSIPLLELDRELKPRGYATGCLISYKNRKMIFSVSHALKSNENWAIQLRYEPEFKKTKMFQLGPLNYLRAIDFKEESIRDIDFTYKILADDVVPFYQEISEDGKILFEMPRKLTCATFEIKPSKDKKYGFCGQRANKLVGAQLKAELHVEIDMEYIGDEEEFYVFKGMEYKGCEFYWGCSGAPIIDTDGNVIALMVASERGDFYGLAINKYLIALDLASAVP